MATASAAFTSGGLDRDTMTPAVGFHRDQPDAGSDTLRTDMPVPVVAKATGPAGRICRPTQASDRSCRFQRPSLRKDGGSQPVSNPGKNLAND